MLPKGNVLGGKKEQRRGQPRERKAYIKEVKENMACLTDLHG